MLSSLNTDPSDNPAASDDFIHVARRLTSHLSRPKPAVYWSDFLITYSLGCAAYYFTAAPGGRLLRASSFVVCVLLWYRTVVFIHEVVHLRHRRMRLFIAGWNLLAGIPLLTPSFLYSIHLEHHSRTIYGSPEDGEYLPWGMKPPAYIPLFAVLSLFAPVLAVMRFLFLTPIGWTVPGLRAWVGKRASAMVVNPSYRRRAPNRLERASWRVQETCTFLWISFVVIMGSAGLLSWRWPLTAIVVLMLISFVNAIRTMASHRFLNSGRAMTYVEQVLDSINHPEGGLLTEMWCPLGLRFHALHHMLPALPYHTLPEAHRILMRALPPDSSYRRTNSPSLFSTFRALWLTAHENRAEVPRSRSPRGKIEI